MDSAGKKEKSQMDRRTGRHCRPVLQLPTGQFSQLANMLSRQTDDPGAHGNEQGKAKQTGRGQTVEEGSGYGMAKASRHTACRTRPLQATQPADSPPGTGLKTNTASSWPASQQK